MLDHILMVPDRKKGAAEESGKRSRGAGSLN
jgi:hypothetical protein